MAADSADERTVVGSELLTVVAAVDSASGAMVLTVVGEVDMVTAPMLHERLDVLFRADRAPIVVDLSRMEFFGSTGLAVVVDAQHRAEAEGRVFVLVAGTRVVQRPLEVTGLDAALSVHEDLGPALEAVRAAAEQRR